MKLIGLNASEGSLKLSEIMWFQYKLKIYLKTQTLGVKVEIESI